jgi:nonribosomal peptide synthetase protein BlmVI
MVTVCHREVGVRVSRTTSGFVGAVRRWAATDGTRAAVTWLTDLDAPPVATTFAELDAQAVRVAAAVRAATRPGDRILLLMPPGPEFVAVFLGCLYAGRIAVPAYPALHSPESLAVAARICADCEPALAWVPDAATADRVARNLGIPAEWRADPGRADEPGADVETSPVAFLQYTSGSTSDPRGVVVSHDNLRANLASIADTFRHDRDEIILSWLPAYHDMGLIGNILHPLNLGAGSILCAPLSFIRRPLSWLSAIDRLNVTTSGAPNFAYDLVAAAVERHGVPPVDLSRWRIAYSGAEPVVPQTMRRFAELLAPVGFDTAAFRPCYGLAEATLLVTCTDGGAGVRSRTAGDGTSAVACGQPRGCEVVVTDEHDAPLPDGRIGQIRVSGDSVAAGYWGRLGEDTFAGPVNGRDGRWLRTGDLGFLAAGELHVAGRSKDVIIVRGRNHYPHDIELLATRMVPALRQGHVVAMPAAGGEGVVIAGETWPGKTVTPSDRSRLGAAVAAEFGLVVRDVVTVRRAGIPRTTSGKLRRAETRRRYEAGEYGSPNRPVAAPETIASLVTAAVDGPVAPDQALVDGGLDSLRAVWLAGALSSQVGVEVSVRDLLSGMTPAELAGHPAGPAPLPAPDAGNPEQLSAAQRALVFLDQLHPGSDEYAISLAWELDGACDAAAFERALRAAVLAQPQLCRRIVRGRSGFESQPVPDHLLRAGTALLPVPVREERLPQHLTDAAALPFSLAEGPLVRLHRWRTGLRDVYQLTVHHVVSDLWSIGLLFEDVADRYERARRGADPSVSPAADRYPDYVARQRAYLAGPAATERDAQLRALIPEGHGVLNVRTDHPRGPQRQPRTGRVRLRLSDEVSRALAATDHVALLTAVWGICLGRYGGGDPVVIGTPVTGRIAGADAVVAGLCTNTAPIAVRAQPDRPLADLVRDVRGQILAGVSAGHHPLARAVEVLRPARALGRNPLVESLVTVQESPIRGLPHLMSALADGTWIELGSLRLRNVPVVPRSCRYDLDLVVTPRPAGGHQLTLDYALGLFEAATAERILHTYAAMVAAAVTPGAQVVGDVFVLSDGDRQMYDTAARSVSPPHPAPAVDLVRRHAATAAQAPALISGGEAVDFATFADRVEHLAGALRAAASDARGSRR